MIGLGTVLNTALVIAGGAVGLLCGNRIRAQVRDSMLSVLGVAVIMIGIGGVMSRMLVWKDGAFSSENSVMMVVCLVLGGVAGELLGIEKQINRFGAWLKRRSHSDGDTGFVPGFVTASCTVCIGAMAVIGAMEDGIAGDYSILLTKGIIDAVFICMMAASIGKGCIFSAIPLFIYQGLLTAAAALLGRFLPTAAVGAVGYVGSVLIACVGLNLIREKKIRVANLLPAILFAAVWGCFL